MPSVVASLLRTDLIFQVLPIVRSAALPRLMMVAVNRAVERAGDSGN
jgi:hypothetical protein